MNAAASVSNWNAPNIITAMRIVATPFFFWLLLAGHDHVGLRWGATAFFVIAIASDAVDGYIARSQGLITDLGKLLDPIADKALTGAALVGLAIVHELPWWVVVVVLVREIGVTVHRLIIASDVIVAADWMGKVKTIMQAVAITFALMPLVQFGGALGTIATWVNVVTMTLAVALTIVSGIDYIVSFLRSRGGATNGR